MSIRITKTQIFIFISIFSFIFHSGCKTPGISQSGHLVPVTADMNSSLPQIRVNDCTFHLETFGSPLKPAILFLPGGLADYRPFLSYTEYYGGKSLTEDYFLILWDQRGKGLSERFNNSSEINFKKYLEDMEAVIDYFCGESTLVIIAHSFGGTFAAQYMNAHPERIAGVVLLESGAFTSENVIRESDLVLSQEWINDLMWCQQFISPVNHEAADFNFTSVKCQEIQQEMHTSELTPFWRVGVAAQHWLDMELHNSEFNFTHRLNEISPAVLLVAGSETERLGVEYQRKKLIYFRNTRLEIIEGAGHGDLIWSKANIVVPLIMEYLETVDLTGGAE